MYTTGRDPLIQEAYRAELLRQAEPWHILRAGTRRAPAPRHAQVRNAPAWLMAGRNRLPDQSPLRGTQAAADLPGCSRRWVPGLLIKAVRKQPRASLLHSILPMGPASAVCHLCPGSWPAQDGARPSERFPIEGQSVQAAFHLALETRTGT